MLPMKKSVTFTKEQYQKTKTKLQNGMRNSYWRYIENMIFDIEINEPDQPSFKNTPKQLYSYIKSQQNENTGIAPLRSEGTLHSNPAEKANILSKQFQSFQYQKSCFLYIASMSFSFRSGAWF
jgi:hypothetical protein